MPAAGLCRRWHHPNAPLHTDTVLSIIIHPLLHPTIHPLLDYAICFSLAPFKPPQARARAPLCPAASAARAAGSRRLPLHVWRGRRVFFPVPHHTRALLRDNAPGRVLPRRLLSLLLCPPSRLGFFWLSLCCAPHPAPFAPARLSLPESSARPPTPSSSLPPCVPPPLIHLQLSASVSPSLPSFAFAFPSLSLLIINPLGPLSKRDTHNTTEPPSSK